MKNLEITSTALVITENFDEIKADLIEGLKTYEIEVTAENLADAKKMATELNKLAKEIGAKRIEKKKEFSEPIKAFEDKANELVDLILASREKILKQAEVYEDKIRQLVEKLLTEELAGLIKDMGVKPEFQTAKIDGLVIKSNLTNNMKLTKTASGSLADMVAADKARQDTVEYRLSALPGICKTHNLKCEIAPDHVLSFVAEPEAVYSEKLNALIAAELDRQKTFEEILRREADKKAKAETAKTEAAAKKAAEDAEQKRLADLAKAEQDALNAKAEIAAANLRAETAEKLNAKAQADLREQAIERAMNQMDLMSRPRQTDSEQVTFWISLKNTDKVTADAVKAALESAGLEVLAIDDGM